MYEYFASLCEKYHVSAYQVSKETGVLQSTLSAWKSGTSVPKTDKLKKIADYFGVTVEYLMTGKNPDESTKYYLNDDTAQIAQEIFDNPELHLLFDAARDAKPEDLQLVQNMLLQLKRRERKED